MAGVDWILINVLGADPLAAPTLNGVVQAEQNRSVWQEHVEQMAEQHAR
jgi:hypothetical protein